MPNKYLASSGDPNKYSLTLIGLIPLIILMGSYFGFDLEPGELEAFIVQLGSVAAGITTLIGLGRKIYNRVK